MPLGKAGCSRSFGAPQRYFQGPGELEKLPWVSRNYGNSAFLIIDPFFFEQYAPHLTALFAQEKMIAVCEKFSGQCCDDEIDRLYAMSQATKPEIVIGIGGGKTCDTAKAVSDCCGSATIVSPTVLATDAPTSAHSIVYYPDHSYYIKKQKKNPDIVLVDTDLTIQAPVRLFAAGMGDALATYVEARSCQEAGNVNNIGVGYRQSLLGMGTAQLCYEVLMSKGREAYLAAANHLRTEAYEDIAEANTLLSGVGFENTGCSIAHGIQASLATLHETANGMHGEQVAYGVLCQLILENRPQKEFEAVYSFCKDIGLPTTLEELGIANDAEKLIGAALDYGLENKPLIKIEPFTVTKERLFYAIFFVDAYGRAHQ